MMNVLIPAAGSGMRFALAGYAVHKPYIEIAGKQMYRHVIENGPHANTRILAISTTMPAPHPYDSEVTVVRVPPVDVAMGAVGTILYATGLLSMCQPVMVINCDNVIEPHGGWDKWLTNPALHDADVAIVTWEVNPDDPNLKGYSYVEPQPEDSHFVRSVIEKEQISEYACAGAFYFRSTELLMAACALEIAYGSLVNGEHYLAPAINQVIARGARAMHKPLLPGDTFVRINVPSDIEAAEGALSHAVQAQTH